MKNNNPIRTCVLCKNKFSQLLLNRYRFINGTLEIGAGFGRSFYLCDECLKKDDKILKKILEKHTKNSNFDVSRLKEKPLNG
ncbi:hypothetical protein [Campylobacter pinnipediorum]|uniref:hypothetical protein n=1 Tax=Campylobacter pinnipediorum TaxID=1965231 RepID=UPI00084D8C5A|nr:hypothetical protein [Campylobacter pinnipediorum]